MYYMISAHLITCHGTAWDLFVQLHMVYFHKAAVRHHRSRLRVALGLIYKPNQ